MKNTLFAVSLALVFWISLPAQAGGWRDIDSTEFQVPPPPARGSMADQVDTEKLLKLQGNRTPEDCGLAGGMRHPQFTGFFVRTNILNNEEADLTRPLVEKVMGFTERVTKYYKSEYRRARPYDEDRRIRPCIAEPGGSKAYPSSHASTAVAATCILAVVYPARRQELVAWGKRLGDLRAIAGVHHPSDVVAGQELGREICDRLKSESDFADDLKDLVEKAKH